MFTQVWHLLMRNTDLYYKPVKLFIEAAVFITWGKLASDIRVLDFWTSGYTKNN